MKHVHIGLVALAAVLIAGCGGGSDTREKELEEQVAGLEQEVENLKKRPTESEVAVRVQNARQEGRQEGAAEGNKRAEEAEQNEQEAKDALQVAEQEAEGTANQLRQNNARRVLAGLKGHPAAQAGTAAVAVTPRYQARALVTNPAFSAPRVTTPGASGKWYRTSITSRDFATIDRLDVYSDVEAPGQVLFRQSIYNDGTAGDGIPNTGALTVVPLYDPGGTATTTEVVDSTNAVVRSLGISADTSTHTNVSGVVASAFPQSGAPEKTFAVVDRGAYTQTEIDAGIAAYRRVQSGQSANWPTHCQSGCDSSGYPDPTINPTITLPRTKRDDKRYPLRWTYETPGSLAGASGTFTCASGGVAAPAANACGVTNQNTHFAFNGPWVFTPRARSLKSHVNQCIL